jgi:hypothetical protein
MEQADDQQQPLNPILQVFASTTILRNSGTVRKPPPAETAQSSRLTNYIAQNRFRLLNPNPTHTTTSTNSGTILRPLQRLQQQAENPNPPQFLAHSSAATNNADTNTMASSAYGPASSKSSSQPSRTSASATRIPSSGYSGLARPTPIQQIVTSTTTKTPQRPALSGNVAGVKSSIAQARTVNFGSSTQLRPSNNLISQRVPSQTLGGSHSKLSSTHIRPRTATTLVRPKAIDQTIVPSTVTDKQKPSLKTDDTVAPTAPQPRFRSQISSSHVTSAIQDPNSKGIQKKGETPTAAQLIALSSVENDVGEIRRLLEQLLCLLQMAHQDQDNKERENERLKQEVRELKSKIRSIRSTVANADSEPPTPSSQNVQYRQQNSESQNHMQNSS